MKNSFFQNRALFDSRSFDGKLEQAVELIKSNSSAIARAITELLEADEIAILPFSEVREEHWAEVVDDLPLSCDKSYPPSALAIKEITSKVLGQMVFGEAIYIKTDLNLQAFTNTLVHEFCHYLNLRIHEQQKNGQMPVSWHNPPTKTDIDMGDEAEISSAHADYLDEVRARVGEQQFACEDKYFLRLQMREIHQLVKKLYPNFNMNDSSLSGFTFSSVDMPSP